MDSNVGLSALVKGKPSRGLRKALRRSGAIRAIGNIYPAYHFGPTRWLPADHPSYHWRGTRSFKRGLGESVGALGIYIGLGSDAHGGSR